MDRIDDRKTVNERKIEEQDSRGADDRFDASQYAFFGRDVTQDVELGGLDEDEDIGHLNEIDDDVSTTTSREEIGGFDISSDVGDVGELSSSFLKLSSIDNEGDIYHQRQLDGAGFVKKDVNVDISWKENSELEKKQWAHLKKTLQRLDDPEVLRASAEQPWWREGNSAQNAGFSLPMSPGWSGQPQVSSSAPAVSNAYRQQQFTSPQMTHSMMHYGSVGLPQVGSSVQSDPWLQPNLATSMSPGAVRHPLPQQTPLMPSQVVLQQQFQRAQGYPAQPFNQMQQQLLMNVSPKFEGNLGDFRDPRGRHSLRGSPDGGGRKNSDVLPQMRSKYMTTDEIETIVRIQWAATHGSDPYIDDYYHQAMQAKVAGGTPHGRRHFAPSHLRELPPHARTAAEPHAYLQVDALGRIPFSSIRRPRPLLDVDGVNATGDKISPDNASSQRRLEQEPMLAARIAVEDGLCLLLDVEDIDRMLSVSPQPDGGGQLRRRRQMLLEGLAASLQLVDPASAMRDSNGRFGLAAKGDLVFLRLVSLPKGRKLLARYLRLLVPGSDLVRIVLMAVFRNLRFLFGGIHSDPSAAATSTGLASAVAGTVKSMDLPSLSACLAAVVLASEPPPLRPVGSSSGDGATIAIQAVLDRATSILSDRSVQYPVQNTSVWQASFDAFFGLLSKYCTNKYESIMHTLMMGPSGGAASIAAAAAAAMSREMPIELLRSSLPHTNEQQRKKLLELAQRSIVAGGAAGMHAAATGGGTHVNTAAVREFYIDQLTRKLAGEKLNFLLDLGGGESSSTAGLPRREKIIITV